MGTPAEMITRLKSFNPADITFGNIRPNKNGGKSIPIYYKGEKLVIQFPKMSTYGLVGQLPMNTPEDNPEKLAKKYSVNLRPSKASEFTQKMTEFQSQIIAWITAHSGECLGQADQPEAVIRALFYPSLKYPKDKDTGKVFIDRDPTFKLKVSYWDGVWRLELFDSERNQLFAPKMEAPIDPEDPTSELAPVDPTDPELAPSGTEMVGLMQCDGIWVAGGRCGVTWRLLQAQLKQPVRIEGFQIQEDSDEEDDEGAEGGESAAAAASAADELSEADEAAAEPEEAEEPEEVPAPKPKAKKSRKKAAPAE
jgi:hypothetical protein